MTDQITPIQWSNLDIALLISLVPLLLLSAFFSCSETAFFRISRAQLLEIQQRKTPPSNAVLYLVRRQRNVLITILIGNMTANVLFFIVGSVLMLHMSSGVIAEAGIAIGTLFAIVIFGEVLPKMAATARPIGIALLLAPPLLLLHRFIAPFRRIVDLIIITPLARVATTNTPEPLNAEELATLVELSTSEGIIDQSEQRALFDVVELSRIRVREAMTPRVRMVAAPSNATKEDIRAIILKSRLTQLPIYGEDLDDIVGMLHTKQYFQRAAAGATMLQSNMTRPQFIPQVATLDQLLTRFRETKTRLAIVVDEFGGTAGLVTLEDVLEELVGEIGENFHRDTSKPEHLSDGRWLIDADTGVREWAAATSMLLERCPAATMGGLVAAKLGRIPNVGDCVQLGNINIEVHSMDEYRVAKVLISLQHQGDYT